MGDPGTGHTDVEECFLITDGQRRLGRSALELTEFVRRRRSTVLPTIIVVVGLVAPMASAHAGSGPRGVGTVERDASTVVMGPTSGDSSGIEDESDDPDDPETHTTTTTSTTTTTTTREPDDSTKTSEPTGGPTDTTTTTTTTVPYLPPVPPELADDPRLPFLSDPDEGSGFDVPIAQRSFDPLSVGVLPEQIAAVRVELEAASASLFDDMDQVADLIGVVAGLEARVDTLGERSRNAVRRAADARRDLRDHAVLAYTQGRGDLELSILAMNDAMDIGVAKEYIAVLMDRDADLAERYERAKDDLDERSVVLADELGVNSSKLAEKQRSVTTRWERIKELQEKLAVYELGARAYVAGFVFPLASDAEFIDSWGYPRMVGTESEHWHQGTDIFAPYGAPAVASENGVIERLGQASLGGNKLWVRGDSGMSYYYAHLSAFAEGMENGRRVRAGEVVGYVGDTGNAKGTSPHLHFETHPAGGEVVNAYPLLRAAYGNRTAFRAVVEFPTEPTDGIPSESAGD